MDESGLATLLRAAVDKYHMPEDAKEIIIKSGFLVLCGVTAAGKNTIVNYLLQHDNFGYVVSHTTRKPRENHGDLEKNGESYWFVDNATMLDLVQKQQFIEVKTVHSDTYGTSIQSVKNVIDQGKRPIGEIDVQGALELVEAANQLRPVFVLPPSYDIWMERLGGRGSMTQGEKDRRFASAKKELELAINHPAFLLLVNNEVEQSAAEIMRGISSDPGTQEERRQLARDLLEYISK